MVSVSVWIDNIGTACLTAAKPSSTAPITRCVGESGGAQLRVLSLDRLQLLEQPVVLGVGDFRRVEHVVAVRVALQQRAQFSRPTRAVAFDAEDMGRFSGSDPPTRRAGWAGGGFIAKRTTGRHHVQRRTVSNRICARPTPNPPPELNCMAHDFDLIVLGAGSGGVAASRRAASHGAKVAIVEAGRVGGTCVPRGCVPKKLLMYAAQYGDAIAEAAGYGWQLPLDGPAFDMAQPGKPPRPPRPHGSKARTATCSSKAASSWWPAMQVLSMHTPWPSTDTFSARSTSSSPRVHRRCATAFPASRRARPRTICST